MSIYITQTTTEGCFIMSNSHKPYTSKNHKFELSSCNGKLKNYKMNMLSLHIVITTKIYPVSKRK